MRLHTQLGFIEALGSDHFRTTSTIADQLGHHVLQAWRVSFPGGIIKSVMLYMNSVTFQHALDEPVYELRDRIHASQPLIQRGAGAPWSQQTWVRWGLFTGRQHASRLVGRKDSTQLECR
eukprot:CAMPEP_0115501736 /NCGR_PEP_ID=MMETSP0271-20121206/68556_1 /TAXON_ID=71861 /ORGANISM="Scrippsiella trochoidea, Strain CCMP3099" /LENGTH=119 /DNA_ID=CAMNT_0002930689 /DNA_START=224 /DNA_END=579 /DNA_ORIENTATION=+